MKNGKHILWIILGVAFVVGCSHIPSYVIPKNKMINVLMDVYRGDALIESAPIEFKNDSLKKIVKQSVFEKHGITQEMFDTSLIWYGKHTEEYVEILNELEKRLDKKEQQVIAEARREGEATIASGDSIDLWDFGTIRFLSHKVADSTMTFRFQPNADFRRGDAYQWQFRMLSDDVTLRAFIGANYEDGSVTYIESDLNAKGWNKLRFQTDSTRNLVQIYGGVTFKPGEKNIALIDSIQLVRTRVNQSNYYSNFNKLKKIPSNSDLRKKRIRYNH